MKKYILIFLLLLCTACGNNIQKNTVPSASPSPEGKILYKIPTSEEELAALPTATPDSDEIAASADTSSSEENKSLNNNETSAEAADSDNSYIPEAIIEETPVPASTVAPTAPAKQEPPSSGGMVWVSESGKKYHRNADCSNMKSPTQVPVDQARAEGKTPCKKCY